MNCRLCDRNITGTSGLLLFDYNDNVETRLGRKINIILNSPGKYEDLSNYCCNVCSYKIEICFSLLVEIQASDEVIRQTYENMANNKEIDTASQMFICGECNTPVSGIKLFIRHYESHILKKTTVGSKKDVVVSGVLFNSKTFKSKSRSLPRNKNTEYLYNHSKEKSILNKVNLSLTDTELVENDSEADITIWNGKVGDDDYFNEEDFNLPKDYEDNDGDNDDEDDDFDLNVDDSIYELKPSSPDLFEDFYEFGHLDSSTDLIQNELNEFPNKDTENCYDPDNGDALSENSFSSDVSYTNLVNTVKKELEKSDSEDESLDVLPNNKGNYTCETCNLSFEYKFILKYHLEKNHEAFYDLDISHIKNITKALEYDYNPLSKCCYCKTIFPTSGIKDHIVECREEFSLNKKTLCQVCGQLFTFVELEEHLKEHSLVAWSCKFCDKKFKARRLLKSHLVEHDENKKKICEVCGKKLQPLSFFRHVMKHREKSHVCKTCGKSFTYNYALRLHMKVHENKKVDSKPDNKKTSKVFCWLCKKDFDCAITLNKHLKTAHNTDGVEMDTRFPCAQCDKKFADMFSLKAHLKLIHEMKDEDISRLKSLPVYRYIECNVCRQVFNSENKIRIHMKRDHGLKPFEMEILKKECEKCGKKFASKQNLIHHINTAHLHIKPMTCDICHEKFAKHSSLIYHKLRHSGEKPFQCEYCQKSYRQRNDVIRHLARHVRDKELTLEEASAINNSPSRLVIKRRIFLKDSNINYETIVKKNRRKSDNKKLEPVLEEEIHEIQEEQMEFSECGLSDSMLYVEEVPVEGNQVETSSEIPYISAKPIYDEERNTIILSSPDVVKSSVKNITYRYIPSPLKPLPAVIVKKQEQI